MRASHVPFLYYLAFMAVLAAAFVGGAVVNTGSPGTAAVGTLQTGADTTPLEKLHREIAGRRGNLPAQQDGQAPVTISTPAPSKPQTISAIQSPDAHLADDAPKASSVEAVPETPAKKRQPRRADSKCPAGQCAAKEAHVTARIGDSAP